MLSDQPHPSPTCRAILGIYAALHGTALECQRLLLGQAQRLSRRYPQLVFHQVLPAEHFSKDMASLHRERRGE